MKTIKALFLSIIFSAVLFANVQTASAESAMPDIDLPAPNTSGGATLTDALKNRKTSIKFSQTPLDKQTLSDLLWAADGVNRDNGKRTSSKAVNLPVLSVYAAFPEGVYKYDSKANKLVSYSKEDLRPLVGKYPLILLYVANLSMESKYLAAVDCGFIAQNVSLFASANNLNTAFLYRVNTTGLNLKLNLKLTDEVLFAQVVGYPPEVK